MTALIRSFTIVDQQEMPQDISLKDFLQNIAAQCPDHLMIRQGQKISLKVDLEDKKVE